MNQPTPEELQALTEFAAHYGWHWKSHLRQAWESGIYSHLTDPNFKSSFSQPQDSTAYLQSVRNKFGASWLVKFKLPTPIK